MGACGVAEEEGVSRPFNLTVDGQPDTFPAGPDETALQLLGRLVLLHGLEPEHAVQLQLMFSGFEIPHQEKIGKHAICDVRTLCCHQTSTADLWGLQGAEISVDGVEALKAELERARVEEAARQEAMRVEQARQEEMARKMVAHCLHLRFGLRCRCVVQALAAEIAIGTAAWHGEEEKVRVVLDVDPSRVADLDWVFFAHPICTGLCIDHVMFVASDDTTAQSCPGRASHDYRTAGGLQGGRARPESGKLHIDGAGTVMRAVLSSTGRCPWIWFRLKMKM